MRLHKIVTAFVLAVLIAGAALSQGGIDPGSGQDIYATVSPVSGATISGVNEVGQQLFYAVKNVENCYTYPEPARTQCFEREVTNVNNYLVKHHVVVNNVGLTKQGLYMFLKDNGLLKSGPATWGKDEVDFCLSQGILVGRTPGTTAQSQEWQTVCTRQELATGLARIARAYQMADALEAAARASGDANLGGRIDKETSDRIVSGQLEAAARTTGDNDLAVGILMVCLVVGTALMFSGLVIRRRFAHA